MWDWIQMTYRPGGVVVLAIFFILFAVLGIILIVFLEADLVATTVQQSSFNALLSIIINLYMGVPLGNALLLATIIAVSSQSGIVYFHTASVILVIFVVLYLLTAFGLLYMKKWGYYLGFIVGILNIVGGVIGLLYIVGLIPLVFGIVVVVYLSGDVKFEFE